MSEVGGRCLVAQRLFAKASLKFHEHMLGGTTGTLPDCHLHSKRVRTSVALDSTKLRLNRETSRAETEIQARMRRFKSTLCCEKQSRHWQLKGSCPS